MSFRRVVTADEEAAAEACARYSVEVLKSALASEPYATMAVSGGSSPKRLFAKLAASDVSWERVHLFWVDERCVPPTDGQSNYKLAKEYLIGPAGIPDGNVHRVLGEIAPEEAAVRYADDIRGFFGLAGCTLPRFDLLHRGMGPDAHTASLFPGSPLIDDTAGIAASIFVPKMNNWRVTLLPGVLLAAAHSVVEASGAEKAEAIRGVFGPEYDTKKYPSQIGLHGPNEVTWFVDRAAAGEV